MVARNPYRVGDVVAFVPDEATIRQYGRAFPRLKTFPGQVSPVIRVTGELVRTDASLKAFPWSQFEPASRWNSKTLDELKESYERAAYAVRGPNPLSVGQRVQFVPSELAELLHEAEYRAAGLYPRCVGMVTAVRASGYVEIDNCSQFYHWSEFSPVV